MKFSSIIVLGTASLATAAQHRNHLHRHARRDSPIEARNPTTTATVPGPVVTVYELNGAKVGWKEVEAGLKDGKYVLVGEKISTVVPKPSSKPTPKPTPSPSAVAAKFFEKKESSSSTTTTTSAAPTTTSEAPASSAAASSTPAKSSDGPTGLTADFPSGQPCSAFPSKWGAVAIDYLNFGGWAGIQRVPGFNFGVDTAVSYIETAISGEGCTPGAFCGYKCPTGYGPTQWPSAQGATKQSVGGLYCNPSGVLELTRSDVTSKLCEPGAGGIKMINKLSSNAVLCKTMYPGTENMVDGTNTEPGQEYDVYNPDQATGYQWDGNPVSAQYYLNPEGVSESKGCVWSTAGTDVGNWAPLNIGVGRAKDKNTYVGIFQNKPTNPDAKLGFNVKLTGDVVGSCAYIDGVYYQDGNANNNGCTGTVPDGGHAVLEFY